MNEENIERLLRKAPHFNAPAGLLEQLQSNISLPQPRPVLERRANPAPWFRRWIPRLSFAALSLACLAILAVQSDSISKLRQENRALAERSPSSGLSRQQQQDQQKLDNENRELEKLRRDNAELQSLRAEVALLREQLATLPQLQAENQKLTTELASKAAGSGNIAENDALDKARKKAQSIQCVNNLKQIGLAGRIFATDHQDSFPADFVSMRNELSTPKILHCPSDLAKIDSANWTEFGAENNSYEMLSTSLTVADGQHSVVFVRCPIHGHVCLGDGSVLQNPEQQGFKIVLQDGKQVLVRPAGEPAHK